MLAIAYNPETQMFRAMRNNPVTGVAESKPFCDGVIRQEFLGDGAIESLLALAKQNPFQYVEVPQERGKVSRFERKPFVTPSRMVL
jgi:hypothetical protein